MVPSVCSPTEDFGAGIAGDGKIRKPIIRLTQTAQDSVSVEPISAAVQAESGAEQESSAEVEPAEGPTPVLPTSNPSRASERAVRQFYGEVEKHTQAHPITIAEIETFKKAFLGIPPARRMGALHRALNLIPDANVELLAGVVFDTEMPTEVVEETFRDIINRSEEVKKPIVEAILMDKTHPCYSDAEWIYEVTGEKVGE